MLRITSKRFGEDLVLMRVSDEELDVWTFEVDEDWSGCGAGRNHVWVGNRSGTITIYDVALQRKSAEIFIPRGKEWQSCRRSWGFQDRPDRATANRPASTTARWRRNTAE